MKNIVTYTTALDYVLSNYPVPENIAERLVALKASVEKRNASHGSDEARAKANDKRKAETAAKRAEYLKVAVPIVREGMSITPRTDKEIYEAMRNVPADMTLAKVRYMLVHNEIGDDVVTVKNGKNPNTYYIKEGA